MNFLDRLSNIGNVLFYIALLVFTVGTAFSCSKDDKDNCNCEGQFVNIETAEYIHQPTDCNRVPPEGYVFVKCLGEPEY